ncbi:MAG: YicC family protein [Sterolibacterium sp.]|nr:YicC family protein [Sterolibacterium sp.]
MIHSMTGFAAVQRDLGHVTLNLELKGVNSRYLDINFRLGEELRFLEMPLRELIAARIGRGKLECRGSLGAVSGSARNLAPNPEVLAQLAALQDQVRRILPGAAPVTVADILRWPGVVSEPGLPQQDLQRECLALAALAIDEFLATRAREGHKLAEMIRARAAGIGALVNQVTPLLPRALADYQTRLSARLREAVASLDEDRIRQEIGVYATRIDVAEELSRLNTHLAELERILNKGGAVGKRLDFLMQELNREANTLASKSVSTDISNAALEMKILIEQMREQVQNLE